MRRHLKVFSAVKSVSFPILKLPDKFINRTTVCKNRAFGSINRGFVFTAKAFVLSLHKEKTVVYIKEKEH